MRIAYVVIALAVLSPAAILAVTSLYVLRQSDYGPETARQSREVIHFYKIKVGRALIPIHPRAWAAAFVLVGSLLWLVGILFLLFVWT
jgi:hypothetical protein